MSLYAPNVRASADAGATRNLHEVLAAKRRRLGTALHDLAVDLARERRRSARLEHENRRLRELLDRSTQSGD